MRVFVAGVMQGSRTDNEMTDQRYRTLITRILKKHLTDVEVIDPWALHPNSEDYGSARTQATFLEMVEAAGLADALVAYVPEASMGTAIEIWEARRGGAKVFTISGMTQNWALKLLSSRMFATLDAFEVFVATGGFAAALNARDATG